MVRKIVEKLESSKTYTIISYYDSNFSGIADIYDTDSYDDMISKAWEFINNGPIKVINNDTGKSARYLDPDEIYYDGEIGIALESKSEIEFCKRVYNIAKLKNESSGSSKTYSLEYIKNEYGVNNV